ncbi:DUF2062 domain-containing protein [Stappia sp. F7233]|uniref:DUF2062 domain-containing protein n=1 Tax=Stappia albiluteola TaxID=2758565 RepID=A0A839AAF6_9HYPH|nr:DUF2062 domain-containing protein [Stappia albiluteola]MBA5776640.1 DUF2062 domain-containing protein [Stappia albiluteola]
MLFRRRQKPTHLERLRVAVWPRHSFARSARYFSKRVLRLTASPNAIALGFAAGAFASITPFIGLHFVLSFVVAFFIGGNMLAAALGTVVGNPLTFPFIWASTYKLGSLILEGKARHLESNSLRHQLGENLLEKSLDTIWPLLKPMLVGAVPIGLVVGALFYFIVYFSVSAYQNGRRERLARRRKDAGTTE